MLDLAHGWGTGFHCGRFYPRLSKAIHLLHQLTHTWYHVGSQLRNVTVPQMHSDEPCSKSSEHLSYSNNFPLAYRTGWFFRQFPPTPKLGPSHCRQAFRCLQTFQPSWWLSLPEHGGSRESQYIQHQYCFVLPAVRTPPSCATNLPASVDQLIPPTTVPSQPRASTHHL